MKSCVWHATVLVSVFGAIMSVKPQKTPIGSHKEIHVARWLTSHGVSVVEPLAVEQPVAVASWLVTFWHEMPEHRRSTLAEVASVLRQLHHVPIPEKPHLDRLEPFEKLRQRIDSASSLTPDDRTWLEDHFTELEQRWAEGLPPGLNECVVHGDPWMGNVASCTDGTRRLLNVDRCSIGRPEWDLVSNAIKLTSTHGISQEEYDKFVEVYGFDVIEWPGFVLLRDIREFRMACHLAEVAAKEPVYFPEARLRIDCLRGRRGPRPWMWTDYVKSA
jgi:aminoglycoside phosphotransferase